MDAKLVEIMQVLAPDRFLIREQSFSNGEQMISREIEVHLLKTGIPDKDGHTFDINEVCCYVAEGMFYRVRVEDLKRSTLARCSFLDVARPSEDLPADKLEKLPGHLIDRPGSVKEVVLRGIRPRSLVVMKNLDLKFGPARDYDESAHLFVGDLVSKSKNWLCLAEKESFKCSSFEANLYFTIFCQSEPGILKDASAAVHFNGNQCCHLSETRIPTSEVTGWREDLEKLNWVSLNQILIEKKFACLLEGISSKDFELHLSKTSSSSGKPRVPESVEKMANRLKASMMDLEHENISFVHLNSARSTGGDESRCAGRGRGVLLKRCLEMGVERPSVRTPEVHFSTEKVIRTGMNMDPSMMPPTDSDLLQRGSLDIADPGTSTSVALSASEAMQGLSSEETNIFEKDTKMNSNLDFQKIQTRGVEMDRRSESLQFATLSHPSESIEKSEVALVHESRPGELQMRSQFVDESQKTKSRNFGRMKYNPMSQMIFNKRRSDFFNPCMVNNIVKASPEGPAWADVPCDLEPISDLREVEFYQLIKRDKHFSTVTSPTVLQSYAWPAVSKLSDFFGIGPSPGREDPEEGFRGGKTAAYLLPLLWQLNNTACYSDLPRKCRSPMAIIVCPSSKHVLGVHNQVASLLSHQDDLPNKGIQLTATYLYGRCEQAKQEASAKKGSHIVVCTPDCLLRMFDRNATSFDNLCHLIFEEADVLLDIFKPQVERIVDGSRLAAADRKSDASPQQILVFGRHWSPELDSFVARNLKKPVVVMASTMEAFYSGGVKTVVECCSSSTKFETLSSVIDRQLNNRQKILVSCATDAEAVRVFEKLKSLERERQTEMFLVSSSTEEECLQTIRSAPTDSENVIAVVSDEMLRRVEVSDSTCVVHFDVPKKQRVLAARLWLMRDHFQKTSSRTKQSNDEDLGREVSAKTVLLLSEEEKDSLHLLNLATFLKRAGVREVPKELEKLRSGSTDRVARLCDDFKSFGFCSNHLHCKLRHQFSQQQDVDGLKGTFIELPFFSIVKVRVTLIKSPFVYNAQILEWVEQGRESQPIPHKDAKLLALRLARQYGRLGNKVVKPEHLCVNELYAWKAKTGVAFRAKLLWIGQSDAAEAEILLVDLGDVIQVKVTEILELLDTLRNVPYQAIEVCICRLKTVDQDPNWNHQDKAFVEKRLGISLLTGRVVFRVGHTVWLDPLEECEKLKNLKVWTTTLDLRRAMLDFGVAEENPEHLQLLMNSSNDLVDLPESLRSEATSHGYSCHGLFLSTSVEELKDNFTPVYVTSVKNPHSFYVQKAVNEDRLQRLHKDIEKGIQLGEIKPIGQLPLVKEMLILVKDGSNWKRAKVLSTSDPHDPSTSVFLLDFGISFVADRANLFAMPVAFKDELPFQAIECFFSDLEPRRTEPTFALAGEELTRRFCTSLEEEKIDSDGEGKVTSRRRIVKPHGTSVDPGGSSDDDDVVGAEDVATKVEDLKTTESQVGESTESSSDPRLQNHRDPSQECDLQKWDSDVDFSVVNVEGDVLKSNLLTAVLVSPKNAENKHAVRLYGYDMGDFVMDFGQKMVLEFKASLTKSAVSDIFDSVDSTWDDDNDDDNGGTTRKFIKKLCMKFLVEEDPRMCRVVAASVLGAVNSICCRGLGCRGVVFMLGLMLKYNCHWSSYWPIMEALRNLFKSYSEHCLEAKQSYIWDSICLHLYNDKLPGGVVVTSTTIIKNLLHLLTCDTCCKGFVEKGGIKAICHFMKVNELEDEDSMLCFGLLFHLTRSLFAKMEVREASEDEDDTSSKVEGVKVEERQTSEKDATDVQEIAEPLSDVEADDDDDDDDDDDVSSLMMDKAIPLLKKIFEQEPSIASDLFYAQKSSSSDEEEEDEGKWGGEGDVGVVAPKTRFFQMHRELNMNSEALITNVWRDARSGDDLLKCVEVVAKAIEPGSSDGVVLASVRLLSHVGRNDDPSPCIRKFRKAGGLNSLVELLKRMQHNEELLNDVLHFLCRAATCDAYTRDHLRSLGLYDVTLRLRDQTSDDEMFLLSSQLLEVLEKKMLNVATTTNDASATRQERFTRHDLAKSVPTVHWSNVDQERLKLRVEARNVVPESLDVVYSDDSVTFRALSDVAEHSFHLRLFWHVLPSECHATVHPSGVVILLVKSEPRIWDRLATNKSFFVRHDSEVLEKRMKEEEKDEVVRRLEDLPRFALNDSEDDNSLSGDEGEPFLDL